MRARSIIGLALTAALTLSAAPTVAAPALTFAAPALAVAAPGRTRPSTAAFCTTMDHFLGFMRSAPRPAVLRKPAGRKLLADLVHTAPHAAARPAATLAHSLAHVAEHGRRSLSARANRAANASLAATARYVVDHCSSKRVTHAYAQLLAGVGSRGRRVPDRHGCQDGNHVLLHPRHRLRRWRGDRVPAAVGTSCDASAPPATSSTSWE